MIYKMMMMCVCTIGGVCEVPEHLKNRSSVRKIIDDYSKEIEVTKNIERRSHGFLSTGPDKVFDGKIHAIVLAYSIDKNFKYEEARKWFYEMADGLIHAINSHEEIGEYFYHYPIGYQDLEVGLAFDYERKGHLKKDEVKTVYMRDNAIAYLIIDREEPSKKMQREWMSPDISIIKSFGDNTRMIRKTLPEVD